MRESPFQKAKIQAISSSSSLSLELTSMIVMASSRVGASIALLYMVVSEDDEEEDTEGCEGSSDVGEGVSLKVSHFAFCL